MKSLFDLPVEAAALMLATPMDADPAAQSTPLQSQPDIPDVARLGAICFDYYTMNLGLLKLTAPLYPLKDDQSRISNRGYSTKATKRFRSVNRRTT